MSSKNMRHKPLSKLVKDKITTRRLSNKQLEDLTALQKSTTIENIGSTNHATASPNTLTFNKYWQAITIFALICLLINQFYAFDHQNLSKEQQITAIVEEVTKNHLKMKPLDMQSNSMVNLQQFFTQLDFSPVASAAALFTTSNRTLLGGRYCSIQGVTAAQLRYKTDEQKLQTLYEVAYDPEKFPDLPVAEQNQPPKQVYMKGLRISMWVEMGLMMVLVDQESI